MDPITALGLVSSVFSFISFGTSLVKGAIRIHESLDGNLDENRSREAIAAEMASFSTRLLPPDHSQLAGEERGLCILVTECRHLSVELVGLLRRIQPLDPKSKSQSLWSALRNKVNEKEKADLEQRLDHCRSQLDLQLTFVNKSLLDALVKSADDNASKIGQLRNNVEHLRQGVWVAGMSPQAEEQIRRLVEVQEDAVAAIVQRRIVKSLAFDGMYGRSDMVDEAYSNTFRWLLDDEDDGTCCCRYCRFLCGQPREHPELGHPKEGDMRDEARAKFTNWLSSGEGIFHISGKLGSGKSTLMKYLGDHTRTQAELVKWAGKPFSLHLSATDCDTHILIQTAGILWSQNFSFGNREH
jgi:hypothetical protein